MPEFFHSSRGNRKLESNTSTATNTLPMLLPLPCLPVPVFGPAPHQRPRLFEAWVPRSDRTKLKPAPFLFFSQTAFESRWLPPSPGGLEPFVQISQTTLELGLELKLGKLHVECGARRSICEHKASVFCFSSHLAKH